MLIILQLMFFGALGGVIGEVLQYWYLLNNKKRFNSKQALAAIVVASISTAIYFSFVEQVFTDIRGLNNFFIGIYFSILIHYGVFVALYMEEYTFGKPSNIKRTYGVEGVSTSGGILILDGVVPVFSAGCFGAALVELRKVNKKKPKKGLKSKNISGKWLIIVSNIVAGGIITIFHGIDHINALTALQLGAAAPLIIKRIGKD